MSEEFTEFVNICHDATSGLTSFDVVIRWLLDIKKTLQRPVVVGRTYSLSFKIQGAHRSSPNTITSRTRITLY